MTIYGKPSVRAAWAETAAPASIADPGNTYASTGWQQGIKPPRQYVNFVLNYVMAGIRYFCQTGVPDWDATETYQANALVRSPTGYLSRGIGANNIGHNPDSTLFANWDVPAVQTAVPSDNSNRVANTAWVRGNFIATGAPFNVLSGSIFNSQVPSSAITQWQGALSIAGSQISSAVAQANTLLINSGYRSIQWSGQSGQPTWLIGSSDGVNFLVWNPSNFHVSNSDLLGGLAPSTGAGGSTIAQRDINGYLFSAYFNQTSANNENPSISQVVVTNGVDGFLRKSSLAAFGARINPTDIASAQKTSELPGGVIIKVGTISGAPYINVPVDVQVNFSTPFPNACVGIFPCTNRSVSSFGQAANGANFASSITRFGGAVTIDSTAAGWVAYGY
jgi:hypothetical protein